MKIHRYIILLILLLIGSTQTLEKILVGTSKCMRSNVHRNTHRMHRTREVYSMNNIRQLSTVKEAYTKNNTEKAFWQNPYLRRTSVTISELKGNEVLFNRTIAYHFSGGQESDKATVNGLPILSSRMDGFNIRYMLPAEHRFSIGDKVVMEIDWNRRNKLMRYHMLCELVLAITNRYFGHIPLNVELRPEQIDNVGILKVMARMTDSGAYVDFDHPDFSTHIPTIQAELNRIIDTNLPIEKGYLNEAQQERYWRVPGIALIPCGGTHVQSTAEVGRATLKREKTNSKLTATGKAERIKIKLISEVPTHSGDVED